jgi:hypothetical protein
MAKKPKDDATDDLPPEEIEMTGTVPAHEFHSTGTLPAEEFHPAGDYHPIGDAPIGDASATEPPPAWLSPSVLSQPLGPGIETVGTPVPGVIAPYGHVVVPYEEVVAPASYDLEDGEPPMPDHIRFESGHPGDFVAWLKEWMGWKTGSKTEPEPEPEPEDQKSKS